MRYKQMLQLYYQNKVLEAGCDEAGRGCLAGPVFAAAVILPKKFFHPDLTDSKQMTEQKRYELRLYICEHALAYAIASVSPKEIDEINILNASFLAMHKAIDQLLVKPELLLIDGNRFKVYPSIPHTCIIKGDAKFLSIAAASVLAKTTRDDYMNQLHNEFPVYKWNQNKGYPTKAHREAIMKFGVTHHHRKSFTLLPKQLDLKF